MDKKNTIAKEKIFACISVEIAKLRRQKFPYVALIFIIIFGLFSAFFREKLSDASILSMGAANGWQIATFAASWTMKIAALVMLIFSVQLIADEFTDRTIKTMLTAPVTRTEFLLGKFFTIFIISFVLATALFITSLIAGASMAPLSQLEERGYVLASQGKLIFSFLAAFLLSTITLSTVGIFGAAMAVILPRAALAIGASLIIYFIFNILGQFDPIQKFLFTSYTSFPIDTAKEIAHGLSSPWTPKLFWCLGVTGFSIFLFWAAANYIFNRKDVMA